jgi:hypothetical protein
MPMTLKSSFPHRHNIDGTHDSICTSCFVTVATVVNETELSGHESAHVCDPMDEYRFSQRTSVPYEAGSGIS